TAKAKKYLEEVKATAGFLRQHLQKIITVTYGDIVFCKDTTAYQQYFREKPPMVTEKKPARVKPEKGSSHRESLALFREGNDMAAIAKLRNLATSTVAAHLAQFVRSGELDVYEVIPKATADKILPVLKELGGNSLVPAKQQLGDGFSFEEIRIVLNYWQRLQEKNG
ncbi:MAG TPA: helix-turn-helix domain-containing protein, partial [Chitinophagaceae bacterium]|nr:helix-turn-helix domain-containing protein [Chitinophagaceae bacterium]